jgi:drug/metabolite transporter (DMT)-like permease
MAVGTLGLVALPAVSLLAAGLVVGEQFQPRHYLPALLLLLGAATLADARSPGLVLGPGARAALAGGLAMANAAALHVNIRRYASGLTQARSWDLDAGVEWWWPALPAPMTVWVVASLAFAVLAWLVLGLFAAQPTSETAPARPTE